MRNNDYDQDVEEDCKDNDKEYQTEEGFLELESPPTSDNKDKIDETLEEKIVKLKGKEDDSNIPTFDQPEKPEEHEDGGGDHIIHDDDVDDGEMDHEEKNFDEEDYDPDSYDKPKDTINEDVWDPFPIVPQTQYSGYDDLAREDVDKNDDHNEDYEGSDNNSNKEENHKYEIFGEEYYYDKNPDENPNEDIGERLEGKENCSKEEDTKDKQLDQEYEGDDLEYKEIDQEPNISDDEGFITNNKEETDKMFILIYLDESNGGGEKNMQSHVLKAIDKVHGYGVIDRLMIFYESALFGLVDSNVENLPLCPYLPPSLLCSKLF
eukprot:Gb_26415 [translate_table: standard]